MSRARTLMLLTTLPSILALSVTLSACGRAGKTPVATARTNEPAVRAFASPEDAGGALEQAVESGDESALLAIFGPGSKDLIASGDPVQDKEAGSGFVGRYAVMHRYRAMSDGSQTLVVGADNFPFPIPLKRNPAGQWYFDAAAGRDEILNRRIGDNELAVIDVCRAAADAQADYYAQLHDGASEHQYAVKFISDPGTQNGLYWKSPEGEPQSPLGPLVAFATAEGYSAEPQSHTPFHGYYFRMLAGQSDKAPGGAMKYLADGRMVGGFAFVAYPAKYGDSGIMTFMINQSGVLLQRDLGKSTADTAGAMTEFDPGEGWRPVQP